MIVGKRGAGHEPGDLEGYVARLLRMIVVDLRCTDHFGAPKERETLLALLAQQWLRPRQVATGTGKDEMLPLRHWRGLRRGRIDRRADGGPIIGDGLRRIGGEDRLRHRRLWIGSDNRGLGSGPGLGAR